MILLSVNGIAIIIRANIQGMSLDMFVHHFMGWRNLKKKKSVVNELQD